ncbi:MAG: molybdopterin-dependent oxidoreductase [Hyphomicrobiales bacterium]|nr:molybdopterin-dependent oxidoreductase [Hyphomicrobiales bacterium]
MGDVAKAPSRRAFLQGGVAAAAGAVAAGGPDPLTTEVHDWASTTGDGVDATPYGLPIEFESDVIRRNVPWLMADPISSINFSLIHALEGTITPQGSAFERHHSGAIEVHKDDYRSMVNGLVDTQLIFTYDDLERLPRENHHYFCECAANIGVEWAGAQLNGVQFIHGMIHNMEYTGVPLRILLQEAGLETTVDLQDKWIFVEGADASSNGRSIPMNKALDDVLVAFKTNGEALRKEHGYPLRLVVSGCEGNLWVKWLRRIEVLNRTVESRKESSKYADVLAVTPNKGGSEQGAAMDKQNNAGDTEVAAVAESTSNEKAKPAEPVVASLDSELVLKGEKVFRKYEACHQIGDGATDKSGPQLNGILGRTIGFVKDFIYSKSSNIASEEGRVWNETEMTAFLAKPKAYMKGIKMGFAGLKKQSNLKPLIAHLKSAGN